MTKFKVTFTETTKYNPATRSIVVETANGLLAGRMTFQQFGRTKITIDNIEEVKDEQ